MLRHRSQCGEVAFVCPGAPPTSLSPSFTASHRNQHQLPVDRCKDQHQPSKHPQTSPEDTTLRSNDPNHSPRPVPASTVGLKRPENTPPPPQMSRHNISSASTFEAQIGYSRAVVSGHWVFVSGCTG